MNYIQTHYKAPRIVLAAAGGVNHDQLVRLSEEHFGKLKSDYKGEGSGLTPCRLVKLLLKIFFFISNY